MAEEPLPSLLRQASQGDAGAVEALLERHLPALLGYVRLRADPLIRNHESCADIVQSVCREVLEDLGGFEYRGEAPFRKWLFAKAMAKLVDRKRFYLAEKRNPARLSWSRSGSQLEGLYATLCTPSQAAAAREDLERLERAFGRLSPDDQKVITLSRLVGMSHAAIAAEMDRKEGAVRVLLHRALGRLGLLMDAEARTRGE